MNPEPEIDVEYIERWREGEERKNEEAAERLLAEREADSDRVEQAIRRAKAEIKEGDPLTDTQRLISEVCNEYREFLLKKNIQYGDSAIHPVRIFSQCTDEEQLLVRIDDKLSRLVRGDNSLEPDEDIMDDLLGYWLLLKVVRRKAERADA